MRERQNAQRLAIDPINDAKWEPRQWKASAVPIQAPSDFRILSEKRHDAPHFEE